MPGTPPFMVASAYLFHSEGMPDRNMEILASISSFISSSACPRLIGADFNMEPAEVQGSQFVQELR
eukprot:5485706-Pyramimonas_sp.AAC.1